MIKFGTDYEDKYMLFSLNVAWKETPLPALKGNNSCKILESKSEMSIWSIVSYLTNDTWFPHLIQIL